MKIKKWIQWHLEALSKHQASRCHCAEARRRISSYPVIRELATDDLPWLRVSDQVVYTRAHHRPLSWYVRTFRTAGLVMAAFEEPEPTEEFLASSPQGPWIAEIPLHCVIEAWKVEGILPL